MKNDLMMVETYFNKLNQLTNMKVDNYQTQKLTHQLTTVKKDLVWLVICVKYLYSLLVGL